MLDLLENAVQLTRHKAYGFIGRMEDWIERLPVRKPMHYADIEQRDALTYIVLELVEETELSWSEFAVMKNELRKRMPSYEYRQMVFAAQVEFLTRVPISLAHLGMVSGHNSAIDLGLHNSAIDLGLVTPSVVIEEASDLDPWQDD